MEWIEANIVLLLQAVGFLVGAGFAIFKGTDRFVRMMEWIETRKLEKAFGLVVSTCQEVYDSTVRQAKEAAVDGELDADEKKAIKDQAIMIAKSRFAEQGMSSMSDAIPVLIEDAVKFLKTKYVKGSVAVNPTLPELPEDWG